MSGQGRGGEAWARLQNYIKEEGKQVPQQMKKTTRFISSTILHSFFVRASVCRPFLALEQGKSQPPTSASARRGRLFFFATDHQPSSFSSRTVVHHPISIHTTTTATDTGKHRTAWRDSCHYPQREGARRAAWNMQP